MNTEDVKPVTVTWAKRNKVLNALSLAPFGLAAALFLVTLATAIPVAAIAPHLVGLGIFLRFFLRRRNPWPEAIAGEARVEDGALLRRSASSRRDQERRHRPRHAEPPRLIERKRPASPCDSSSTMRRCMTRASHAGWDAPSAR